MQITIDIPDLIGVTELSTKIMLSGKLYEMGHISLGKAAEICGYSKATFIEIMNDYGIKMIEYNLEDFKGDMQTLGIK